MATSYTAFQLQFTVIDRVDVRRAIEMLQRLDAGWDGAPTAPMPAPASMIAPASMVVPPEEDPRVGVELDSNGSPWIEEVHASTKSKNKDGTWKKRRGVDDADVTAAEEAARARLAGTPEPVIPEEAAAPEQVVPEEPAPTLPDLPDLPGLSGLPGAAPAPAPAEPEAPPASMDDLSRVYSQCAELGLVKPEEVMAMYTEAGAKDVNDIAHNDAARAKVTMWLQQRIDNAAA